MLFALIFPNSTDAFESPHFLMGGASRSPRSTFTENEYGKNLHYIDAALYLFFK